MDFITSLPKSEGKDSIFLAMDRLTKYALFCGIQTTYTTNQVPEELMRIICNLHGFPNVIVSDRDLKFTRNVWKELWNISGTTLTMSLAYQTPIDGETKIVNTCLKCYLHFYSSDNQHYNKSYD